MRKWILLAMISMEIACSGNNRIPSDVIGKDEMQKVLWDMIQASQFSKQFLVKDTTRQNLHLATMRLYNEVLAIHHISEDEFKKSYQFYFGHPNILKVMFDSLSVQGNRKMRERSVPLPLKKTK
jgi:hypothetical protein